VIVVRALPLEADGTVVWPTPSSSPTPTTRRSRRCGTSRTHETCSRHRGQDARRDRAPPHAGRRWRTQHLATSRSRRTTGPLSMDPIPADDRGGRRTGPGSARDRTTAAPRG